MTGAQLAAKSRNPAVQSILLRESDGAVNPALVLRLCEESRLAMRTDIATAAELAEAAYTAARHVADQRALAEALRMRGHVSHLTGNNKKAVASYQRAVAILDRQGARVDAGRTRSSALQSLIYLGQYDMALAWAGEARSVFEQEQDTLRLARLDSNHANILHRQDRYQEALALYARAVAGLRREGDLDSVGIALRNMAVCHTALYEFDRALACYAEAEALYRSRRLPLLAAEIADNVAQLYHLRGDYIQALQAYRGASSQPRANTYQTAVGRLDQSELLLELNLFSDAAGLAADAAARFQKLGIRYEQARALLNEAIATFRLGDAAAALRLLARSRRLFTREQRAAWEATVDFYKAAMLLDSGEAAGARENAAAAVATLDASPLVTKSIPALLLLSRIECLLGKAEAARDCLRRAQQKGLATDTLPVRFQLAMQAGQLCEAEGDAAGAWEAYLRARDLLESIRGQFGGDGLRMSFASDKLDCYSRLVALAASGQVQRPLESVLEYVEQAKSRSLAEAIVAGKDALGMEETEAIRGLRQQLRWSYHQLDRNEAAANAGADALRIRIRQMEERLSSEWALRAGTASDAAETRTERFSVEGLQACLDDTESLLAYFVVDGELLGFVVRRAEVRLAPLGPMAEVEQLCRRLRFQLSRGTWAPTLVARRDPAWLAGTRQHLQKLYEMLVAPLRPWLSSGHWIVVPHGILHRVPFHALHDGRAYLIDERSVSYAPSAAVYWSCQMRPPSRGEGAAVFASPDERAPKILDEGRLLASQLGAARQYLGAAATLSRWFDHAPACRLVHLATHGLFREDNPLFSSLRLSDGRLSLYDLYGMRLEAELVTLSGCATGVYEPQGGDEVMGLTRGLLIAGARAAQVSLWEVDDDSAMRYMQQFYAGAAAGWTLAEAARQASLATREAEPHPFYWAPFVLTGFVKNSIAGIFCRNAPDPIGVST